MPILPGDELSGDCQYVGNTPIQPHKAEDGTLARATSADLDAVSDDVEVIRTGMVIMASRKQAYIDAYAALGLGVCDEDDAPFAAENAPLMIRFEPAGGLQVWLTGRDFIDYAGQLSDPEYWQLAFDRVVAYAVEHVAAERTKIVVLSDLNITDGTEFNIEPDYFPDCTTKPADWTLTILDESAGEVTAYFAGSASATPDETAVLIIGGFWRPTDVDGIMATLTANATTIRSLIQNGCGMIAWSELFTATDPSIAADRGLPLIIGWSWLDDVFPGLTALGMGSLLYPWEATDDGESLIPGMTASLNYSPGGDTAQTGFTGAISANGFKVLVTNAGYNIEIGGVPNL